MGYGMGIYRIRSFIWDELLIHAYHDVLNKFSVTRYFDKKNMPLIFSSIEMRSQLHNLIHNRKYAQSQLCIILKDNQAMWIV